MANFNYCPAVLHFIQLKTNTKLIKYENALSAFYTQITVHHTVNFCTKRKPALWNKDGFILHTVHRDLQNHKQHRTRLHEQSGSPQPINHTEPLGGPLKNTFQSIPFVF